MASVIKSDQNGPANVPLDRGFLPLTRDVIQCIPDQDDLRKTQQIGSTLGVRVKGQ